MDTSAVATMASGLRFRLLRKQPPSAFDFLNKVFKKAWSGILSVELAHKPGSWSRTRACLETLAANQLRRTPRRNPPNCAVVVFPRSRNRCPNRTDGFVSSVARWGVLRTLFACNSVRRPRVMFFFYIVPTRSRHTPSRFGVFRRVPLPRFQQKKRPSSCEKGRPVILRLMSGYGCALSASG